MRALSATLGNGRGAARAAGTAEKRARHSLDTAGVADDTVEEVKEVLAVVDAPERAPDCVFEKSGC